MKNNKKDFPLFKNTNFIYFDNSGTSIAPKKVIDATIEYYTMYSINTHNSDSKLGFDLLTKVEEIRSNIQRFIGAEKKEEIIFIPSTTFGINQIAYGLKEFVHTNDEIIITEFEHASNFLPWVNICNEKKAKLKFLELKNDLIDLKAINKIVTKKTKIVSFASVTNTFGYINNIDEIIKVIRKINKDIIIIIDAAQAIVHDEINVKSMDVDFLVFSAHKIFGPTGIGILYGKEAFLEKLKPMILGGGMSNTFSINNYQINYNKLPNRLEGGTPNVAGIFGLGAAIKYLEEIGGTSEIQKYVFELKEYAVKCMKEKLKDRVIFYNVDHPSATLLFNIKGVFSQDVASFLGNEKNIIVRAGELCVKLLKYLIKEKTSIRISFSIYNDKTEIDKLVNILVQEKDFLGILVEG